MSEKLLSAPPVCLLILVFTALNLGAPDVRAQAPSAEAQVAAAVEAAPAALRDSARVLGYRGGALVPLREGQGPLVCLADDPSDERFHVACYHETLEPFMARGRALRAQGLGRQAADSTRRAEIEKGALVMPGHPAALYSLTGPDGTARRDSLSDGDLRRLHVIYTPYATAASTGLPTSGQTGEPWIMEGGQPWAHVMIFPPPSDSLGTEE